jgi:hypothetical protein
MFREKTALEPVKPWSWYVVLVYLVLVWGVSQCLLVLVEARRAIRMLGSTG